MDITISQPYGFSQIGRRATQQDALAPQTADAATRCFVVCDGVGGMEHGEVASALVAEFVEQQISGIWAEGGVLDAASFDDVLRGAYECLYANRSVSKHMATTLAVLVLTPKGVFVAHVGDSPVCQFRRGEGIVFRTHDHSLVADLVERGELTAEEAATDHRRNIITRCLSVPMPGEVLAQAEVDMIADVRPGDVFMVCSDGVNGHLSEAYLSKLLSSELSLTEKGDLLKSQCADSHDNNTAWLVEIDGIADMTDNNQPDIGQPDGKSEAAASPNLIGRLKILLRQLSALLRQLTCHFRPTSEVSLCL